MAEMLDVACWLADHGLGHHAETFAKHGVGGDILRELTDADLKELGLNLGDRKRLLKAIAALNAAPTTDRFEGAEATAPIIPRDAERRQLTVMFVDLVGSTELAARLDPEDMSALIRAYQNAVAREIARFEGHVAKFMGDGVLAYFGWPRAHEDEAERAVRAGLAIIEALAALESSGGETWAARIGIATGPVVVGELIGHGAAQEQAVVGETPNLAARLQAIAEPRGIVISRRTRRLVGRLFKLVDLGLQHLKGFAEPVRAWRVVGIGAAESRFEAQHDAGLLPLVGREQELALLLDRWAHAKNGEGQVVLLSGEAGIGKSRITLALREHLRQEPRTSLRYFCSPYHTNSALYPVIVQLERAADFTRDDPASIKLAKLEALLAQAAEDVGEALVLLAELLSVSIEGRKRPQLTPQQRRARTFAALLVQLEGLAGRQPVLMVLEDAHWLDPTGLELFGLVVDRIQHLPVLLVVTHRPEFELPWRGYPHVTILTLNRLARAQARAMVEHLTGGRALPSQLLEPILAKSDGVPLFVEELTKTVLESGLVCKEGGGYVLSGPLPPLAIPATLQDSLMARLDRLASVKDVAQIGAVIGREFDHELLAAVAGVSEAKLEVALAELVRAGLLFCRGVPPDASYVFKHALVQETAYQSLLKSRRQQLHGRIAHVLENRSTERPASSETIASHFLAAGEPARALPHIIEAVRALARQHAYEETLEWFEQGLHTLADLPDNEAARRAELDLYLASTPVLMVVKGFTDEQTLAAARRAQELCEELGAVERILPVLFSKLSYHNARAEFSRALPIAVRIREYGEAHNNKVALLVGNRTEGFGHLWMGKLENARALLERALEHARHVTRKDLALEFGHDPTTTALALLGAVKQSLGFVEQGRELLELALKEAIALRHPLTQSYVLRHYALSSATLWDFRRVAQLGASLTQVCRDYDIRQWEKEGPFLVMWARLRTGTEKAEPAELAALLDEHRVRGMRINLPLHVLMLAEVFLEDDLRPEAASCIDEAAAIVERTRERWVEPELLRLRARLCDAEYAPDSREAEHLFEQAVATARRQGAKIAEVRAATSLARLWAEQGRRAEAHDLLAPVYGWFTEGFDGADLKDAKALLEELR